MRQDFVKFEASILEATLEADESLDPSKTSVTVMASEEQVAVDGYVIQLLVLPFFLFKYVVCRMVYTAEFR